MDQKIFEIHLEGLEDYQVNCDDLSDSEDPFVCISDDDSSDMETDPSDHLSDNDEMIENDTA